MSEYGFGYYGGEAPDEAEIPPHLSETPPADAGPKWFRDYMEKTSKQMKALTDELDQRRERDRREQVAETLKSKGYAPSAASLYEGDPTKVDEWLTRYGDALARQTAPEGEPEPQQRHAGPPQTTISPTGQEQMQRLQSASIEGTGPLIGGDNELAASLAAARTPEEFQKIAATAGWKYDVEGLFGA